MKLTGINSIIIRLRKSDFAKNILILFSGSTISQLILLLSIPLLTRLYSDSEIGMLTLYSSIVSVLTIIATLKYELAIVLPRDDHSGVHLLIFSFIVSLFVSMVLFLVILCCNNIIVQYIDKENILGRWLLFIPLSVFFIGVAQAGNYWLNRKARFKPISTGKVYKSLSTVTCQVAAGYSDNQIKIKGLIGGVIIGQFIHGLYTIYKLMRSDIQEGFKFSFSSMRKIAWHYRELPMYNTLAGFINIISNNLPVFLFTGYYGINTVGLYGMALRLTQTPLGMINAAIGEVFFSTASRLYEENRKEFLHFTLKTTYRLIKLSIIPFIIFFIVAPKLLVWFLGSGWEKVGTYTQIILPWLFVMFVNSHLTSLITIIRKQKQYLFFSVFLLLLRFMAIYLGYAKYNDIIYSLLFYSAIGVIFNVILFFYLIRIGRNSVGTANI